ncbi:velvet factor [Fomitopsis betulina]|nr:velvet factor [Fomitopsis betulina]
MSQKHNTRASTSNAPSARQEDVHEPPTSWGSWAGNKYYSLEVAQNPLRARMCGFGDKDRRPLAPAAVAKMIVRTEDGGVIDVDEIDTSFFLVTVDLWSADGTQEMNLVLHPTSADRYVPTSTPKPKRRSANASAQRSNSGRKSPTSPVPIAPAPAPPQGSQQYIQQPPSGITPQYIGPSQGYPPQVYPYNAQQSPVPESSSYQSMNTYGAPSEASQPWAYPPAPTSMERASQYPPAPVLPSIHSLGRNGSSSDGSAPPIGYNSASASGPGTGEGWHLENQASGMGYRTWPSEASYPAMDNNGVTRPSGAIDPSLRASHAPASSSGVRENSYSHEPYTPVSQSAALENSTYPSASYPAQSPSGTSHYHEAPYAQDPTPPSNIPPLPRHTYTRTLVGPLCANACRLLDEHRTAGVFFLFQDLSIRTEGTFRLRLRLMNIGAPPAPEPGAPFINTGMSKILAQTFTESFIVYSAKRFPGVPETTALSIALGNQGQKLPLRNRNPSTKQGRKRPRSGSEASGGEESDD